MQRKSLSLFSSLLALTLILFLQSASKAYTVPGWIYSYGGFMQNGYYDSVALNIYDHGTYFTGGFSITATTTQVKFTPTSVHYNLSSNGACNDVTLAGTGTFTSIVGTTTVTVSGTMNVHLWRGTVNGVTGTWLQSELWSTAPVPVLLWATGSTWPAVSSSPVKLAGCVINVPVP